MNNNPILFRVPNEIVPIDDECDDPMVESAIDPFQMHQDTDAIISPDLLSVSGMFMDDETGCEPPPFVREDDGEDWDFLAYLDEEYD